MPTTTDIWGLSRLESTTNARKQGHEQGLRDLLPVLNREWEIANETFMLFRQQDSNYQDWRTDFTLGRRDAIMSILNQLRDKLNELDA